MERLSSMLSEAQLQALEIKYGKSIRKALLEPTGREGKTHRIFKEAGSPHLWTLSYDKGRIIGVSRAAIKY